MVSQNPQLPESSDYTRLCFPPRTGENAHFPPFLVQFGSICGRAGHRGHGSPGCPHRTPWEALIQSFLGLIFLLNLLGVKLRSVGNGSGSAELRAGSTQIKLPSAPSPLCLRYS